MVRAGLGVSIVPAAAASLRTAEVELRPLRLHSRTPVELFMVWRRDDDNPLLPPLVEIAGDLGALRSGHDRC
jgi:DNA-binding transcriptional LysR family regulator